MNYLEIPTEVSLGFLSNSKSLQLRIEGQKGVIEKEIKKTPQSKLHLWWLELNLQDYQKTEQGDYYILSKFSEKSKIKLPSYLSPRDFDNEIQGVRESYILILQFYGVGFNLEKEEKILNGKRRTQLNLKLGFSHTIDYILDPEIEASILRLKKESHPLLSLVGPNKQRLHQVAAEIRKYRPPSPYTGKGILIYGEEVEKKQGKEGRGK